VGGGEVYSISAPFPGVTALLKHLEAVAGVRHLPLTERPPIPAHAVVIFGAWRRAPPARWSSRGRAWR